MSILKKPTNWLTIILLGTMLFEKANAQNINNADSTKKQLDKLMASKNPTDRQLLVGRLKALAASGIENNMSIAGSYYFMIKNAKASDSVFTAEIQKFPKGLEARIRTQQAISRIKSLPEMEKAYYSFVKSFPPENYPKLPFGEDRLPYDRLRSGLAIGYAKEKNVAKASYYASLLDADFWKVRSYGDIAEAFYASGDLANATLYQQKAVESAKPYAEGKMGNSITAGFAVKGYPGACDIYAKMLYEQKKYSEALKYIETAILSTVASRTDFNYTYGRILTALNRYQQAFDRMEAVVKSGEANNEMSELFKFLYIKIKGSDTGLDTYEADIRKGVADNMRKRLTKSILNEPAANFTLTDLQGNRISLSDLKGKVVILDFWATWCVPCKASFPAMQMAVNKYKNDPDVKFLFIHTWERSATAIADARTYIDSMKYNFQVLMDMKDPETKANKVVDSYKVSSIPTKFVIDGNGNIRFRLTGFDGSNEAAVDEISMMVDIVNAKK